MSDGFFDIDGHYTIRYGDALAVETGIIVHGCNCQGIMGGGIALQVRNRFPIAYNMYREAHRIFGLTLGEIIPVEVAPKKYIVNAMTQDNCGSDKRYVDYEAIAKCFEKVTELARSIHLNQGKDGVKLDIVFPMIGAGLAGGNWKIIETIILETIGPDYNKVLYKFP